MEKQIEEISKIYERCNNLKKNTLEAYLNATPETKDSIVKILIDMAFDTQAHKEYQDVCDKIFNSQHAKTKNHITK